ncbi:hypothetical protein K443DRAFT_101609 [Laccaria amethystina LaAM-08-1]|uniref:Uncharacterized protein n=1 Tax=Laccaria amethystina LaAM-08-1 TaxID=1095629 RepID=A0A0C9X429_9AGAR|nr:hypothetical protein K443DRAFT_101609 [Laccaria amethystina LaAM-08-1]
MVLTQRPNLPPSSNRFSSRVAHLATVTWPSQPDLPLLPEVETKPYGRFRGRVIDIAWVESC